MFMFYLILQLCRCEEQGSQEEEAADFALGVDNVHLQYENIIYMFWAFLVNCS